MIEGIGIDIVEMQRIHNVLHRQERFPRRILTQKETQVFERLGSQRQLEFLAGHFAAKEAYAKALGTGIGECLSWQDIEMIADDSGKPFITSETSTGRIHVSISHTKEYAVAQVILESL